MGGLRPATESGVFHHHQTIYCKYLHHLWMATKDLSQPFYMLTHVNKMYIVEMY